MVISPRGNSLVVPLIKFFILLKTVHFFVLYDTKGCNTVDSNDTTQRR